jgi:hypothetical protein
MGYLKFREGDMQAARKWYGEAVKLDSQSYLAHYYYAAISMGSTGMAQDPEIETSLHACMKLNPGFAPAYDALAMYYSRNPAKANEAHLLNIQAINFEPDNLNYRLNAAAVLTNEQQYIAALAVLKAASRVARTPEQAASVQARMEQIEQYNEAVERSHQAETAASTETVSTTVIDTRTMTITGSDGRKVVLRPDSAQQTPKYPTEAPTGIHHTARGILRSVHCSYPTILTLSVDQAGKAPAVTLYRNDFNQIEFSATNFTPKGDLNPCTDIEGLKAKVGYAEVSDKSVAGQILTVELTK